MNKFTVEIKQNGTWQRINATPVFPFMWGELLDERLDEANLTVYDSPVKTYPRLTDVRVTITNGAKVKNEYFIIASDNSLELPAGSGKYKHELYLIERTKLLEGIFCSTITFTNAKGTLFTGNKAKTPWQDISQDYPYSTAVPANFESPIPSAILAGEPANLPSASELANLMYPYVRDQYSSEYIINVSNFARVGNPLEPVTMRTYTSKCEYYNGSSTIEYPFENAVNPSPRSGTIILTYVLCYSRYTLINGVQGDTYYGAYFLRFTLGAVSNRLPLKRWSITDCVTRACELAEPLFGNDLPRYRLDGVEYDENANVIKPYRVGSLAEKYDKVFAPEFTATEDTLREQLKLILSYVHAEPWLDENNVIRATEYGGTVKSPSASLPYVYNAVSSHINEYCTEVRSHAQNLASSLGYARGVITDPGKGVYRSLRSDTAYVRITEGNGIAVTRDPIYTVESVMCGIATVNGTGWRLAPVEITPNVFEETEYSANLSSYAGGYPYSKQYAIYYTQGAPNLRGLFYKAPDNMSAANFSPFAISNILSSVTGVKAKTIDDMLTDDTGGSASLVFSISYKPISNHFVSHGKQLYVPSEVPYMQLYNQSENLVESQYYGENLRGVAFRLGNVEKERTFILRDIDDVPRVGELLDGYAISAVSCELTPFDIKCTVGLSKDFNRISQYVGINSTKRMYEISERAAVDRALLIKETLVIGKKPAGYSGAAFIFGDLNPFYNLFDQAAGGESYKVSLAEFSSPNPQPGVYTGVCYLPVISRSLGNVLTFNLAMKDNYSAGTRTEFISSGKSDIQGRWENDLPYTDYYGRVWSARVRLFGGNIASDLNDTQLSCIAYALPARTSEGDISPLVPVATMNYHRLRKDNRERISYNLELDVKTTREDLIIGSALTDLCGWVSDAEATPVIYHFDPSQGTVGKFDRTYTPRRTDVAGGGFEEGISGTWNVTKDEDGSLTLNITRQRKGYGWVICTPIEDVSEEVEDEYGNVETVTYQTGGDILLASNAPIEGATLSLDLYIARK